MAKTFASTLDEYFTPMPPPEAESFPDEARAQALGDFAVDARDVWVGAPRLPDRSQAISAAFAEGMAQGRRNAQADVDAATAAAASRSVEELAIARRSWVEIESEKLASDLKLQIEAQELTLRREITEIMDTWIFRALQAAAIDILVERVEASMYRARDPIICVQGQPDLAGQVVSRLADKHIEAVVVPADGADLKVDLGETSITTNIVKTAAQLKDLGQ